MNSENPHDVLPAWDWMIEKQRLAKKWFGVKILDSVIQVQKDQSRQGLVERLVRLSQNRAFNSKGGADAGEDVGGDMGHTIGDTTNYNTKTNSPLASLFMGGSLAAAAWFASDALKDIFAPTPQEAIVVPPVPEPAPVSQAPSPTPVTDSRPDKDTQYDIGLLHEEDIQGPPP